MLVQFFESPNRVHLNLTASVTLLRVNRCNHVTAANLANIKQVSTNKPIQGDIFLWGLKPHKVLTLLCCDVSAVFPNFEYQDKFTLKRRFGFDKKYIRGI